MGLRDSFSETSTIVKVAFLLALVSLFCSWLAFTTTSWVLFEFTTGTVHYGLWRLCGENGGCNIMDGTGNVDYGVTQAFAIIGFMCQNVGFLLIVLFIFKESCRGSSEVGMASAILWITSAIGWLISVAVYGGHYNDNAGADFHYSYGLAVVACFLGLFSGITMFIGSGNGSVGSK